MKTVEQFEDYTNDLNDQCHTLRDEMRIVLADVFQNTEDTQHPFALPTILSHLKLHREERIRHELQKDQKFSMLNTYLTWLGMVMQLYAMQFEALSRDGFVFMRRSDLVIKLKESDLDGSLSYDVSNGFFHYVVYCEKQRIVMSAELSWFTVECIDPSDTAAPQEDPLSSYHEIKALVDEWNEMVRHLAMTKYNKKVEQDDASEGVLSECGPKEFNVFALFSKLFVPIMSGVDKN
jgi:hypothetical protein